MKEATKLITSSGRLRASNLIIIYLLDALNEINEVRCYSFCEFFFIVLKESCRENRGLVMSFRVNCAYKCVVRHKSIGRKVGEPIL